MPLQFENPTALWGLIFVVVLFILILNKKKKHRGAFSNRRLVLSTIAFTLCIFGLSRPQLGRQVISHHTAGANLFLALDVSRSMLAEDISPSRLAFSTSTFFKLIELLPGVQVAVFPFSADGFLLTPLTSDQQVLKNVLSTVGPSMTTNQGTDLTTSLGTLLENIERIEKRVLDSGATWLPTQVLLYSDGESHWPLKEGILQKYRAKHIPIFTVGTGTKSGGPVPIVQNFTFRKSFLKDGTGKRVTTKLDDKQLRRISNLTGGDYLPADTSAILGLKTRLKQIARAAKTNTKRKIDKEYYPILFAIAMILFLIEFSYGRWEFAIRLLPIPLIFALLFPPPLTAKNKEITLRDLKKRLETTKDSQEQASILYNMAVQFEKQKHLKSATELYEESALLNQSQNLKKKILFNLGNTLLMSGKPQEALQNYQEAFNTKYGEENTDKETNQKISENMVLAKKIEQEMKRQGGKQSKEGKEGQDSIDPKGPKTDFQAERFSEARKKRIFDMIAMQEQEILQRIQRKRSKGRGVRANQKPW